MKDGLTAAGAVFAAGLAAFVGGAASAATVSFDTFTDTDAPSVDPLVSVTDSGSDTVTVNASIDADSSVLGSLILLVFDVGTDLTVSISDLMFNGGSFTDFTFYDDYDSAPKNANFNGNPLNGGFDFAIGFDQQDDVLADGDLSFELTGSGLDALDFLKAGLRLQRVGSPSTDSDKRQGSDKLISATPELEVIPLPAAGFLLLGGVGGLGALRALRRKS